MAEILERWVDLLCALLAAFLFFFLHYLARLKKDEFAESGR